MHWMLYILYSTCHSLLECNDFFHLRNKYFHVDIKQLFNDVPVDSIFFNFFFILERCYFFLTNCIFTLM